MSDVIISVKDVIKTYKGRTLLDIPSLTLNAGNTVRFIGDNGSGKSMLFKLICGFVRPDSGTVTVSGKQLGADVDFPQNVGFVIENTAFMNNLTDFQNLHDLASIRGRADDDTIRSCMTRLLLNPDDTRKYRQYSTGMRRKLSIAQAIMERSEILVLDEPFNGLDDAAKEAVHGIVDEYRSNGATILYAQHSDAADLIGSDVTYRVIDGSVSPVAKE